MSAPDAYLSNPMENEQAAPNVPDLARTNIDAIMRIERGYLRQRSVMDRLSDRISTFVGSAPFLVAQIIFVTAWIIINLVPGKQRFDPYPFLLLALIVGIEAIFLSTFVLISQNRQAHQEDHWAHLHLQIGLLAEQENAKILQLLKAIAARIGLDGQIAKDAELADMAEKKPVGDLAEELAEKLEKTRDREPPIPNG